MKISKTSVHNPNFFFSFIGFLRFSSGFTDTTGRMPHTRGGSVSRIRNA